LARAALLLGLGALAGCGGGGGSDSTSTASSSPSSSASSPPPANVLTVTVGSGPNTTASNVNIPYVTVTVCVAGTGTCASIDHVLLDTGSTGLRLMSSVLKASGLALVSEKDAVGNAIGECAPFASGYTSGLIALADVSLAGETAAALPLQVIDDTSSLGAALPCTGNSENSVTSFDANGVLGAGVFAQDCGAGCAQIVNNGWYYKCTASLSCSAAAVAVSAQVANPVSRFPQDNNGVVISLPAIGSGGVSSVTGTLTFGIGTQSDNVLSASAVLPVDASGRLVVTYAGRALTDAFIDSGSNSIDFADSAIPACNGSSSFYCPGTTLSLTATNQGTNGTVNTVTFTVANFQMLRQGSFNAFAYNDIAGQAGTRTFDWGLPFFYGRNVYTAIEGRATPGGAGPYFAY
jgi:hypothetical protein